jgi:GTPase SAR1 family protein
MFSEIENKELSVSPVAMKADGVLADDLPPPLDTFKSGHNLIICGASGMGKSTLMLNLISKQHKKVKGQKIRQSFRKCFHNIFIVSPSLNTLNNNVFSDLDENKKATEFDEDWLNYFYEELDKIKHEGEEAGENHYTLLILDDVAVSLRKNRRLEQKFVQLLQNRRHLGSGGVSVWCLVQSYLNISPQHRNNLTHFITMKPKTPKERNTIFEDLIGQEKNRNNDFFNFVFRDKHDFLMIDFTLSNSSADYDYYRNFNKIVFQEET